LLQVIIRLYRCLRHIGDIGNHHHHLISKGHYANDHEPSPGARR
jgi:hypothetical protein